MLLGHTLKLTFHLLVVANYLLFLKHCARVNDDLNAIYPGRDAFMGQWKYLTHINVAMQMALFILMGLDDLLYVFANGLWAKLEIKAVVDFIFTTLGFPIGMFVSVSFWGLYSVNRDLVFPDELDEFFPPATNHMMHTAPAVTLFIELYCYRHQYPPSVGMGVGMITSFMALYYAIIVMAHKHTGVWVYGLFEIMSDMQRYFAVGVFTTVTIIFYIIGDIINTKLFPIKSCEKSKKAAHEKGVQSDALNSAKKVE